MKQRERVGRLPRQTLILVALASLAAMLAACQPKATKPSTQPPSVAPQVDTTGAVRYEIDSAASDVHILVYRGGAMARLGHNHVVSSKDVSGKLLLHDDLARSQVELSFPVAALAVDEPAARASEGEEFSAAVPDDAREGTRSNLLRPEVLDAERFPRIALRSVAIWGAREMPALLMRVTIKDVSRDVVVLAKVTRKGPQIIAAGEFEIQQTDFGIKPFTVAMGALQVQDKLRIKFSIVCRQQQ